jgi:hypothetical protein
MRNGNNIVQIINKVRIENELELERAFIVDKKLRILSKEKTK